MLCKQKGCYEKNRILLIGVGLRDKEAREEVSIKFINHYCDVIKSKK